MLRALVEKWSGPAGFLVLFGAIVWGVQLNVAILSLNQDKERKDAEHLEMLATQQEISSNLMRATLLIDAMNTRVEANARHIEEHMTEAEVWKRRISVLEDRSRNGG